MKKGFTLAELLGVITIIGLIALLVLPVVTQNITGGKRDLYQIQIENFEQAAKDWIAIHLLELPEEDISTSITIGCLKAEGLLEESIKNPLNEQQFPNDMVVKIESSSNQYIYTVVEDSGTSENVPIPSEACHFNTSAITE